MILTCIIDRDYEYDYVSIEIPAIGFSIGGSKETRNLEELLLDSLRDELGTEDGLSLGVNRESSFDIVVRSDVVGKLAQYMIKSLRQRTGMSQRDVADRMGEKSHSILGNYEIKPKASSSVPGLEILDKILCALDLELVLDVRAALHHES